MSTFIKPEFWNAFTRFNSAGWSYRPSVGRVVPRNEATEAEDIPIPDADEREQKGWLSEFLGSVGVSETDARSLLEDGTWYLTVCATKSPLDDAAKARWRAFRAERIVRKVERWLDDNELRGKVAYRSTFETPIQTRKAKPSLTDADREVLLNALRSMPTQELVRLPIPYIYLQPFLRTAR